ncbi:hypothetical protein GGX14DRAFT_297476, partial [Mycena pura]
CARHRFETTILPRAMVEKWPSSPNFGTLRQRILAMRGVLLDVAKAPRTSAYFWACRAHYEGKGISWAHAGSTMNQFSDMQRQAEFGAGYYGLIGLQIIEKIVTFLFPDHNNRPQSHTEIPYKFFLRETLIPEAVVRLVQDDFSVSVSRAQEIIKASHTFGIFLHP